MSAVTVAGRYSCGSAGRRQAIIDQTAPAGTRVNALDYLVVSDGEGVPPGLRQRLLGLRFFFPDGVGALLPGNVTVTGGVRSIDPPVRWIQRASALTAAGGAAVDPTFDPALTAADRAYLASFAAALPAGDVAQQWLVVLVERAGDFSLYSVKLRASAASDDPPAGFDRRLSEVELSFKVECPSPFDCGTDPACTPAIDEAPPLDYLARDFASFRRLMFDRLALTQPDDTSTDAATLRATLVEVLAYAADHVSYYQDAVATEAYLGTARRRPSVRRHARLLDYQMHDGCNARTFVHLTLADGRRVGGATDALGASARFTTRVPELGPILGEDDLPAATAARAESFESLHVLPVASAAHNEIAIHTWGDGDCCLPAGATTATLVDDGGHLEVRKGDFLLFEEVRGTDTGLAADADPRRRHVVRLTDVLEPVVDTLLGATVREVTWHEADALPFSLTVSVGTQPVAVARGNMVLVDHGATISDETLAIHAFGNQGHRRARLTRGPLTFRQPYAETEHDDFRWRSELRRTSAAACLVQDARAAVPVVGLDGENELWTPARDLLSSAASAREFVVETETDGRAWLRFGDGVMGRAPAVGETGVALDGQPFLATYRIGNGGAGNVGAEAIAHLVADPALAPAALTAAIAGIRNPVAATGGVEPEPLEDVRQYAPQAFRTQERAVTEADWAEVAQRHPGVQRAVATIRWTGSYHTVFVSVDRLGGEKVEGTYERDLLAFLEHYRLAGYDLEVSGPSYVALDVALTVCVHPDYFRDVVEERLVREFGAGTLADGSRAFFHPDNFTFGSSVYLSQLIARAAKVPGVLSVDVTPRRTPADPDNRFKRWGEPQGVEIEEGVIRVGRLEIARCDNDRNAPDNGQIRFFMRGGA